MIRSLSFGLALAIVSSLAAQENPENLVQQAYQKTQTAKTLEEFDEIIALCGKAMQGQPGVRQYAQQLSAWAYNRRGEVYAERSAGLLQEGRVKESERLDQAALEEFKQAVEANPKYWKSLHNRGVSYALAGRYDQAIKDFGRALEQKPDYANAWFNRGEIYYEQGEYENALRDYSQVLKLTPQDPEAQLRRGHAYFQMRQFRKALDDYGQAVQLAPRSSEAHVHRGDAHCSLGDWERAASDYRRAIQFDESSARAYQSAAWLMATCPDERFRHETLAVQAAQRAVQLEGGKDFKYYDTLAAAYANANQFDKAQQAINKAINIASENVLTALEKRLAMYEQEQPYRQKTHKQVRTASKP